MASSVASAFAEGNHLLVEAGTGVGKSFAYLLPAIDYAVKSKKRVVISTHTISLQEQLIEKDIPLLQSVYPMSSPRFYAKAAATISASAGWSRRDRGRAICLMISANWIHCG